jgi:hypothetical protein
VRYFDTMAHEGSHALMRSAQGSRIVAVRLHWRDADGSTSAHVRGRGLLAIFIGYLGPSLFGLAAAKLIAIGHSVAVLWLALALLGLLAAVVRNVFGIVVTGIAGLVIYEVARYSTVTEAAIAAYLIAWLLLFSGIRVIFEHWADAGDAYILQQHTRIMPVMFARAWLAGAILALFLGGKLMI